MPLHDDHAGYTNYSWPADADKDWYRAEIRAQYPAASEAMVERTAKHFAALDARMPRLKGLHGPVGGLRKLPEHKAVCGASIVAAFTKAVPHPVHEYAIVDVEAA